MPPDWSVSPEYVEWVGKLWIMGKTETCMAFSLANAARMAGRSLRPERLLDIWESRGICLPGSTPVVDGPRALKAASTYLRDVGVEIVMKQKVATSSFAQAFPHVPTMASNPAHVITLGPGYMRTHHDTLGKRLPKRRLQEAFAGPGHDVLVLGMEGGTHLIVHDPDPQLKAASKDERFAGAPVVRLARAHYRNYFASGDHARTLTAVSPLFIKPKGKGGAREKGQRRLPTGDD